MIIQVLIKAISHSIKPLECMLKFLDDHDIMSVATTCRALYRYYLILSLESFTLPLDIGFVDI